MAPLADAPGARWWVDRSGQAVASVVLAVAVTAWVTMLTLPGMQMPGMHAGMAPTMMFAPSDSMNMGAIASIGWNWADLVTFTAAWALMMAAMMLPSATPMLALYGTVVRRRGFRTIAGRTTMFAAPYVALWALSGIPVYASTVWIDTLIRSYRWAQEAAPYAVATTLLTAGIYQFTPLKRMCLANCRNPLNFLASHWRPGLAGAARIGFAHAFYCFGCCALLMVVLVAAGAMGLVWVLLIAGAVALEKLAPRWLGSPAIAGAAMIALGAAVALLPSLVSNLRS
jgi:predicted metal-binding membrane protein